MTMGGKLRECTAVFHTHYLVQQMTSVQGEICSQSSFLCSLIFKKMHTGEARRLILGVDFTFVGSAHKVMSEVD